MSSGFGYKTEGGSGVWYKSTIQLPSKLISDTSIEHKIGFSLTISEDEPVREGIRISAYSSRDPSLNFSKKI
jgi:hypothetical protein